MKMIDFDLMQDLLRVGECESVDFKQQYENDFNKHVHDILCLLNSDADGDRYIIFGVEDKTKNIIGIENDPFRDKWRDDFIQNWLHNLPINRPPTIAFYEINFSDKSLGVLAIKNRHDKPFYLLKNVDKARAFVVYTRHRSINTPVDSSADEVSIENMWRERFGINLSPIEKMNRLIKETDNWYMNPEGNIIHNKYSEFSIIEVEQYDMFDKDNVYRKKIKILSASKHDFFQTYHIYYFNVLLAKARVIIFDEYRYLMPDFDFEVSDDDVTKIFIDSNSLDYYFYKILIRTSTTYQPFEQFQDSYNLIDNKFILYPVHKKVSKQA